MTFAEQINVPAFIETVAKQCDHVANGAVVGSVSKAQLLKFALADCRVQPTDVEFDKFLLELVRAGHLRTSGGRFWVARKAKP